MTNSILTPGNIMFVLGLLAILFSIYRYFKDPQIKSDQTDGILTLEIKQLKEEIINLKDNHIHSLREAIVNTNNNLNNLTVQVAKLSTVVEERLPRK